MSYLTDELLKLLKSYEEDKIELKDDNAWERPFDPEEVNYISSALRHMLQPAPRL